MLPRAKTLLGALVVESRWCREVAGEKIFPTCRAVQRGAGPAKFVRIRAIRVYLSETLPRAETFWGGRV